MSTTKPRKRRSAYKHESRTTTVSAAIGDAFSIAQELRDELTEWKDNLEEKLSHTDKYSRLEDSISQIEGHCDNEPDVPESVQEHPCSYIETVPRSRRKAPSRASRMGNAVAMLQGAREALEELLQADPGPEEHDEIDALITELEEAEQEFESVEFPGMYG